MYYDHTYVYVRTPAATTTTPLQTRRRRFPACRSVGGGAQEEEGDRDRANAMAALLLPLKNWSQVLGLHTRRMGGDFTMGEAWEKFNAIVAAGTFVARHASGARGLQVCPSTRPAVVLS